MRKDQNIARGFGTVLFLCLLLLSACSGGAGKITDGQQLKAWMEDGPKMRVLSTTAMINDVVKQVGDTNIRTLTLITGEIDPHSYQLVKGDDEKLAAADLVFYNGLGLEHGPSLQQFLKESKKTVNLGEAIQKANKDAIIVINGVSDPHVWLDIALWVKTVDTIVEHLSAKDPANAKAYYANGERVKHLMDSADEQAKREMRVIPMDKRYLVTSHDAFNYFTRAYLATPAERRDGSWAQRCAAPEGLAPEGQLSVKDIQDILTYISKHHVKVIFPESNVSADALKKVVDAGAQQHLSITLSDQILYADSMGPPGSDGDTYLKMMRHNVDAVVKHLK